MEQWVKGCWAIDKWIIIIIKIHPPGGLNPRPPDQESGALPTELDGHLAFQSTISFIFPTMVSNQQPSKYLPLYLQQNLKSMITCEIQIYLKELSPQNQSYKMNLKPNPEDNGVITKQFLKKLCKTDFKNYYSTPQLNDILYLHYKGFNKLDNLYQYTGLKCIYLEGNVIKKIEGLQKLVNLRCLYLQENMICKIEGLETLTELSNLNLSENLIEKVEGLGTLTKLSNLQLKNNRIGNEGLSDVIGLLECPSVSALDISCNKITTDQFLPEVLMKMPQVAVVYLQNNQFTKNISHYRKTLISKIPHLKYIDDKPVFQDERRFSQAWARGGLQQERKQRILYKKQKQQQQLRQHEQFRQMLARHRAQKPKEDGPSGQSDSESLQGKSLQTYKSPEDSHENSERTSEKQSSEVASDKQVSEKELSEKAVSEKAVSEKAVSEKDKSELPRLEQFQVRTFKAQQKNKSIYLDELD